MSLAQLQLSYQHTFRSIHQISKDLFSVRVELSIFFFLVTTCSYNHLQPCEIENLSLYTSIK